VLRTGITGRSAQLSIDAQRTAHAAIHELAHQVAGGRLAPEFMTERNEPDYARFESGYDPADPLDQAIMATRAAVFPEHGMMPLPSGSGIPGRI
jgi:acetoin utilization protein AcuC